MQSNVYILDIDKARSGLISKLEYDLESKIMSVSLRYKTHALEYVDVPFNSFEEMSFSESIGKYYLNNIKSKFKLRKMSDKKMPKGINIAKDEVRWIDISIDVQKILKEWLVAGEKGTYLNMKLRMLPDGQVDQYECLGFITQTVPKEVYNAAEKEKKGSGRDIKNVILGNAKELQWGERDTEGLPGQQSGNLVGDEPVDDLPF